MDKFASAAFQAPQQKTTSCMHGVREPTFIDILHDRAARLLYGGYLQHVDKSTSYERPNNLTAFEKRKIREKIEEEKREKRVALRLEKERRKREEEKRAWTIRNMTTCQERLEEIGYGMLHTPVAFDNLGFDDIPFARNYDHYHSETPIEEEKEKKPRFDEDDGCIFQFDDL